MVNITIENLDLNEAATATNPNIKLSGTFGQKPIKVKAGGTFAEKTFKVKVGGTFQ